jgi:hypothetical protein
LCCVAFQLHHGLQAPFFTFLLGEVVFLFAGWRFLLLPSYDDDRAYDMKLGGLFFYCGAFVLWRWGVLIVH